MKPSHGHVRRAALPHLLHLPRRRLLARGADRPGGRARAVGARHHRRERPLRRGRGARGAARPVRPRRAGGGAAGALQADLRERAASDGRGDPGRGRLCRRSSFPQTRRRRRERPHGSRLAGAGRRRRGAGHHARRLRPALVADLEGTPGRPEGALPHLHGRPLRGGLRRRDGPPRRGAALEGDAPRPAARLRGRRPVARAAARGGGRSPPRGAGAARRAGGPGPLPGHGGPREGDADPHRRHQRRPLPRPGAQVAPRRAAVHPGRRHPRDGRLPAPAERGGAPQVAPRHGGPLRGPPRGGGAGGRACGRHRLPPLRGHLPLPGARRPAGDDPRRLPRTARPRGARGAARREGGGVRGAAREGAGPHRRPRLRRLLPHHVGHRAGVPPAGDPLPGARLRGQQPRLLRARHHLGPSRRDRHALRALRLEGAPRAARHRPRHRARAAGADHPVRLREVRPAARRHGGRGDPLPQPLGRARGRQGDGAVGDPGRSSHDLPLPPVGRPRRPRARGGRLRPEEPPPRAPLRVRVGPGGLPPPPLHPHRRLRPLGPAARRDGSHRERAHGEPDDHPVGQDRRGRHGDVQGRPPRPRHAVHDRPRVRPDRRPPRDPHGPRVDPPG